MAKRKSMQYLMIALVLVLATLSACGPAATPAPTAKPTAAPTVVPPTPVPSGPQGTLTVAHGEKLEALDPQARLQIHSYNVALTIYDSLVDVDETGAILPRLATAWEVVDDNTWKFTLRQGVKFHNGEPFTCESVKFTLDRVVNPETKSAQVGVWAYYDHTECPDEYTALVKTKSPMGTILTNLALTAMLPPKAGPTMNFSTQAIGTGPYKFVEYVIDDHLTLEANTEYWRGAPKIKTVVSKWIPEITTRMTALETGEVDLVWGVAPEERARLESAAGVNVVEYPTYTLRFLWMNAGRPPLDNPKVRDAIRYAIDIDGILETLLKGQGTRATSCVAQGVFGFCDQPTYPYDPDKAKALLAEAGYGGGLDLEVKLTTYLSKNKELAEVIADYLADVGVTLKITTQDQALWIEDLLALNWDMNLLNTGTITGDADFTLRRVYQTSAKRTGYYNDQVDKLLVDQQSVLDMNKRADMICEACQILWDDGPTVWLSAITYLYGYRDRVKGFVPHLNQFLYYDQLWLE